MKPFERINLFSVLSSVLSSVALAKEEALAKGDALCRGRGKCCQCENVASHQFQFPIGEAA